MKKLVVRSMVMIVVLAIAFSETRAFGYEETPVTEGGTLSGRLVLEGDLPMPKGYNLTTLPDAIYCGRISDGRGWRLLQPFHIGTDGAFQDVVVYIQHIEKGKAWAPYSPPRIEAIDCRFLPFINLVRDQHEVQVVNMDPAMHDIQAYETSHLGPRVLFNVPLPISTRYPSMPNLSDKVHKHHEGALTTQMVKMTRGRRVFLMQCGFHAYMESWALAMDHPYYTVTDHEGRFQIADIPPGAYKVAIWHPYLGGEKEYEVTIAPKQRAVLDVTISAPTGRLYANQVVENPFIRYTITEEVQSTIIPSLERQTYK